MARTVDSGNQDKTFRKNNRTRDFIYAAGNAQVTAEIHG
jgi:hypothetical protein